MLGRFLLTQQRKTEDGVELSADSIQLTGLITGYHLIGNQVISNQVIGALEHSMFLGFLT